MKTHKKIFIAISSLFLIICIVFTTVYSRQYRSREAYDQLDFRLFVFGVERPKNENVICYLYELSKDRKLYFSYSGLPFLNYCQYEYKVDEIAPWRIENGKIKYESYIEKEHYIKLSEETYQKLCEKLNKVQLSKDLYLDDPSVDYYTNYHAFASLYRKDKKCSFKLTHAEEANLKEFMEDLIDITPKADDSLLKPLNW